MNQKQSYWRRFRTFLAQHRLLFALSVSIIGALCLTFVSLVMYNNGGYARYDLSRPGFEKERQELATTPTNITYDTTSLLTADALNGLVKDVEKHSQNLNNYDTFGSTSLSDEDLHLVAPTTDAAR